MYIQVDGELQVTGVSCDQAGSEEEVGSGRGDSRLHLLHSCPQNPSGVPQTQEGAQEIDKVRITIRVILYSLRKQICVCVCEAYWHVHVI